MAVTINKNGSKMSEYEYSEGEDKKSKYNAAISQLYRLDTLWQSAHLHARSGRLMQWNWDLDSIWRELAGDAKDDDEKSFVEYMKHIAKAKKLGISALYYWLTKKEIFLRRLQNKQGKGTAYQEGDEEYMS